MNIPIAPRAYAKGYQACLDGKSRLSPDGTTKRAGWLQGYDAAMALREEWEADCQSHWDGYNPEHENHR